MYSITNKKYQKVKILLNESESVVVEAKKTKKINITKASQHMLDLERDGFISLKKIEKKKIEKETMIEKEIPLEDTPQEIIESESNQESAEDEVTE